VPDAVVIGAGPNGLVAANLLADAGWSVLVLEAQPEPGGAVRSADYLGAGYVADMCSAFYPLAAASPAIRALQLEQHGLEWRHAGVPLAHPLPDGRCAVLSRDLDATADNLERLGAGDGAAWRRLVQLWDRIDEDLLAAVFAPFPPVAAGARLAARLRVAEGLRFARMALLPVRRHAEEEFTGPGAAMLLAGNAMHADLAPESNGSLIYGWLLAMLAQRVGFPVPRGGAGQLTAALVGRLESRGGQLRCDSEVTSVLVRRNRAVGVCTRAGDEVSAARAVIADVVAPRLFGELVPWSELPARLHDDMRRFQWDFATFKTDWALSAPVPWTASEAGAAGTVHLAADMDELTRYTADIATGRIPADPFLLIGQMTTSDPARSPAGTEVLWAYTHVPRTVRSDPQDRLTGRWDESECNEMADRMEMRIERFAPGFRERIISRHAMGPPQLESHNANLVGGSIQGGTTQLHQQLVFRPAPGTGRPETPVAGLYLASSSAHPGGGVHGACGANAARAALRHDRAGRRMLAVASRRLNRR
jgi:phytoene dehydrogenase-like protein